ncbi:thiamine pyrophosphate-dependent enzyme [Sulfitobacter pontiacus]
MGYSVPAGVSAALAHKDQLVLSFVGDGGFMMSGQELATAAQYGATPIVLLLRRHLRHHPHASGCYHPERISGTTLINQDFCKWPRATARMRNA